MSQQQEQQGQEQDSTSRSPHLPSITQLHTLPHYVQAANAVSFEACAAGTAAAAVGPASAAPAPAAAAPTAQASEPGNAFVPTVSGQLLQLSNVDSLTSCNGTLPPGLPPAAWFPSTYSQVRMSPADRDVNAGGAQLGGGDGGDGDGDADQPNPQPRGMAGAVAAVAAAAAAAGVVFDEADVISGRVDLVQQVRVVCTCVINACARVCVCMRSIEPKVSVSIPSM
mgnify:CR=1 FL=1